MTVIRLIRQAIENRKQILAEGGLLFLFTMGALIYYFVSSALQPF